MRAIHIAHLDKARPVLVLTRELVRPHLTRVTVAPITSTVRGLSTEVSVGPANGLDQNCVVSCDNIVTIPVASLGRQIGFLLPRQEPQLSAAIHTAFDLD
ncbi:type II toxin-antitoxin system PemK/MazF family toxin [Cryobacterium sp. TMT1-3]|uniref:Type II toxin-antitoxin system PemK/MazF family toxin n=2 Tax=Microbacteriaceae TaxID=85023 RepID=A0A5F0DF64_9MICO|nr:MULTISPECIES: type II toxin-antitoxin system PemK/MazF family toxin [Cryobacterium]TFB95583.1 type II toxin-antitoxin system PemK/MazF family toxin [Cryobacterium luteum]TFC31440.1 type II toxin-antitoxin system PemK/MazF family toxin [Cryobacterium sp. TMT1-3]